LSRGNRGATFPDHAVTTRPVLMISAGGANCFAEFIPIA